MTLCVIEIIGQKTEKIVQEKSQALPVFFDKFLMYLKENKANPMNFSKNACNLS